MNKLTDNDNLTIEELKKKITAIDTKVRFTSFGKTKHKTKAAPKKTEEIAKVSESLGEKVRPEDSELVEGLNLAKGMEGQKIDSGARRLEREAKTSQRMDGENKGKSESKLEVEHRPTTGMEAEEEARASRLWKKQSEYIEEAINKIKIGKPGNITSVFKMREIVAGLKKPKLEAHAVIDSKTGEVVVSNEEIKRVNLEHCLKILKDIEPVKDVKQLVKLESDLHDILMNEETDKELEITEEEYNIVVDKFKSKNKRIYDFLTKSGKLYKLSIYKLCKRMLKEESFPDSFCKTTLHQLWKPKGSRQDLGNHRYIHMKEYLPRLCEALKVNNMKEDILENTS